MEALTYLHLHRLIALILNNKKSARVIAEQLVDLDCGSKIVKSIQRHKDKEVDLLLPLSKALQLLQSEKPHAFESFEDFLGSVEIILQRFQVLMEALDQVADGRRMRDDEYEEREREKTMHMPFVSQLAHVLAMILTKGGNIKLHNNECRRGIFPEDFKDKIVQPLVGQRVLWQVIEKYASLPELAPSCTLFLRLFLEALLLVQLEPRDVLPVGLLDTALRLVEQCDVEQRHHLVEYLRILSMLPRRGASTDRVLEALMQIVNPSAEPNGPELGLALLKEVVRAAIAHLPNPTWCPLIDWVRGRSHDAYDFFVQEREKGMNKDFTTPRFEAYRNHNFLTSAAISPDGRYLATCSTSLAPADCFVRVWALSTLQPLATLSGERFGFHDVQFSRDGRMLAAGCGDCTLWLWRSSVEVVEGEEGAPSWSRVHLSQFAATHFKTVNCVAFGTERDRLLVASGSQDSSIKLWYAEENGQCKTTLRGHTKAVYALAFSLSGEFLASGSEDCTARMWGWSPKGEWSCLRVFEGHSRTVFCVSFHPKHGDDETWLLNRKDLNPFLASQMSLRRGQRTARFDCGAPSPSLLGRRSAWSSCSPRDTLTLCAPWPSVPTACVWPRGRTTTPSCCGTYRHSRIPSQVNKGWGSMHPYRRLIQTRSELSLFPLMDPNAFQDRRIIT